MEVFVAKQPIYNRLQEVYAYELLYRKSLDNSFPDVNGDEATADVIINSYLNIGIDKLSEGKPCFINFTEKLLQLKIPTYFGPREIVIEVLETVRPTEEIVEICKELKELGYRIALDDVIFNEDNDYGNPLFQLADYIKVDFLKTEKDVRRKLEKVAKELEIKLVAEKIETKEAYEDALEHGYHYFQGFLFAKPTIISTYDIPTCFFLNYDKVEGLSMTEESMDFIINMVEKDPSITYKLLKLVNSPLSRTKQKIYSVKQAVMLLGLIEIKKWLYVLSVRAKATENINMSKDMIHLSLTRAKMCESIERIRRNRATPSAYFTLGMFSLVDKLVGVPMEKLLVHLPLHDDLSAALTGVQNSFKDVLDLVTAVEQAEWSKIKEKCQELRIEEKDLFKIYAESLTWSNQLMEEEQIEAI